MGVLLLFGYAAYRRAHDSTTEEIVNNSSQNSKNDYSEARETVEAVQNDKNVTELLKKFGQNWINYQSIYQRNQSVKQLLTEECIKENGIDSNPNVEVTSIGQLLSINKNIDDSREYVLAGLEKSGDKDQTILMKVTVADEEVKITKLKIYYIISGF